MLAVSSYKRAVDANALDMDMDSGSFSGWAVPNGQAIDKSRFPGAYEVFGSSLPIIGGYIDKLNPFTANV